MKTLSDMGISMFIFATTYLLGSFVYMNFNPSSWHWWTRLAFSIIAIIVSCCVVEENNNIKNKRKVK